MPLINNWLLVWAFACKDYTDMIGHIFKELLEVSSSFAESWT